MAPHLTELPSNDDADEWTAVTNTRKRSNRRNNGIQHPSGYLSGRATPANIENGQESSHEDLNPGLVERFGRSRIGESTLETEETHQSIQYDKNAVGEYVKAASRLALSADRHSWLAMPEIPAPQELFDPNSMTLPLSELDAPENEDEMPPHNVVDGPWPSKEIYLQSHYRLLREDAIRPLREAVQQVRANPEKMEYELSNSTIGLYDGVYIAGTTFAFKGVATRIVFSLARVGRRIHWEQSKRLTTGSLVALTPANNMFSSKCVMAIVAARPLATLALNPPEIDLYFAKPDDIELDCRQEWVMVEERAGFFEAERHTLTALQKLTDEPFPLQEHLIDVKKTVEAPEYLKINPVVDMSSAFGSADIENLDRNILEDWPTEVATSLDTSQLKALQRILTKRLAVVQGPPGTGKTHVSVVALMVMLSNMQAGDPPIVVSCQTNHALDQLLRHVMHFEPLVARIGARSKDPEVKKRTVYELKHAMPKSTVAGGLKRPAITKMKIMSKDMAMLLTPLELGKGLSDHKILLNLGVITGEQARSLDQGDDEYVNHGISPDKYPIQIWLGKSLVFTKSKHEPVDLGFEFEEADLEFEQLREQEAENVIQDEEDWEALRGTYVSFADNFTGKDMDITQAQMDAILATDNLWRIPQKYRGAIFCFWQRKAKKIITDMFRHRARQYNACAADRRTGGWQEDVALLAQQKVIGLTTTGLSKNRALLAALKSKIVLIEEAAETLEAPIIAACLPSLEHLILVGDHRQLRPHTHVQQHEEAPYFLNVSLFERLVRNGIEFAMLKSQRRMSPEIRRILKPIYGKAIRDHPDVKDLAKRPPIPGMGGVNSYFFNHNWSETFDDTMSAINNKEAEMIVGFYKYLVFNGMKDEEITVLTFYNGQRKKILSLLKTNRDLEGRAFKVATVDSYQGEENTVILLSLVRSNPKGSIGFLKVDNRVCVALSRAKSGFYIFGNGLMLCEASKTWADIISIMWGRKGEVPDISPRRVGHFFPIQCDKHGNKLWIEDPFEWDRTFGGCMSKCVDMLPCGHRCQLPCHPFSHDTVNCTLPCALILDCGHPCEKLCCDSCGCSVCVETKRSQDEDTDYDSEGFQGSDYGTPHSIHDIGNDTLIDLHESPKATSDHAHVTFQQKLNMASQPFGQSAIGTETQSLQRTKTLPNPERRLLTLGYEPTEGSRSTGKSHKNTTKTPLVTPAAQQGFSPSSAPSLGAQGPPSGPSEMYLTHSIAVTGNTRRKPRTDFLTLTAGPEAQSNSATQLKPNLLVLAAAQQAKRNKEGENKLVVAANAAKSKGGKEKGKGRKKWQPLSIACGSGSRDEESESVLVENVYPSILFAPIASKPVEETSAIDDELPRDKTISSTSTAVDEEDLISFD